MENTGYKSFETLERYYTDDRTSTGETKPNIVTDPDYIAPFLDITNCPPGARFYNTKQTKTITRNNCGPGYSGSTVTLTANANQFVSNQSELDANNQAIAWLDANAQIYANNVGTCEIIDNSNRPNAPIIYSTLLSDLEIKVFWTIPDDNAGVTVTGYQLYRKVGLNGQWLSHRNINSRDITSFTDTLLSYETTYHYRIQAQNTLGNWSNDSEPTAVTTADRPNCFVEGTLISLSDGTQLPIEQITLNQMLLSSEIDSLNDTNNVNNLYKWSCNYLLENRIKSPVTGILPLTVHKTIIVNEGLLEATPSHSQLIQRNGIWKFIPLEDIVVGDNLYNINKKIIPVTSVVINLEKRNIYPLSLAPSHTYFANGILTHNIKPIDN